jgi:hypothetical protein
MSSFRDRIAPPDLSNEQLRVALYTTLSLFTGAAEILAALPAIETTAKTGDQERFRLLSAAEAAYGWLVGHGSENSADSPSLDSALGGATAALDWTEEELDRHFAAALSDWTEPN